MYCRAEAYALLPMGVHHYPGLPPSREKGCPRVEGIFANYGDGQISIIIDSILPLAEDGAAHDIIERRQTKGKLLLATGKEE